MLPNSFLTEGCQKTIFQTIFNLQHEVCTPAVCFFLGAFFAKFPNVLQKSLEIQRNVVSLHKIKNYEL